MSTGAVAVSAELRATLPNGVELAYQTYGDPGDPALLMVMGLGGPMIWWDPEFLTALAERGLFVIGFDNRDTGHSTRMQGRVTRSMLLKAFVGRPVDTPYSLEDLADDGFALLDVLGIERAHVLGISMGGMIAQTMALAHPERVLTLTSIMSTTGKRTVGWQDPRLFPMLLSRPRNDREGYVARAGSTWVAIGSPLYPDTSEAIARKAGDTWDRGINPAGVARQMVAILAQRDRTRALESLAMPSLVIHGLSDKMVHVSGGRLTSRALRGSELILVPGMGHDLPIELQPMFVDAIARTTARTR